MYVELRIAYHFHHVAGLERQFGLTVDRSTMVKMQKLKFKGRAEPTVMRKQKEGGGGDSVANGTNKENDPLAQFPYPYENGVSSEELANRKAKEVSIV